jgi:hypothetical protein
MPEFWTVVKVQQLDQQKNKSYFRVELWNKAVPMPNEIYLKNLAETLEIEEDVIEEDVDARQGAPAGTWSKTGFFSSLMAFLRMPMDSVLAILTGNTWRGSSLWTKQLSSRLEDELG